MSDRNKAALILAKLVTMHRSAVFIEPEDIQDKCTSAELDFYYFWIVQGGKTNGHDTR